MAVCGFWRYKGGITWEEIRSSRNSGVMRVWRYNGGRYIEGELYIYIYIYIYIKHKYRNNKAPINSPCPCWGSNPRPTAPNRLGPHVRRSNHLATYASTKMNVSIAVSRIPYMRTRSLR